MSRTRTPAGYTVAELLVSIGIFSLLSLVMIAALRTGTTLFVSMNAKYEAAQTLRQAESMIQSDLKQTDSTQLNFKRVSTAAGCGDVLWFLSAENPEVVDPYAEKIVRDPYTATPMWQRNIVYYCVRVLNHNALFGSACAVDPDPTGDSFCPHKVLIRKVVDNPVQDDPEVLLTATEIDTYTTQPTGMDISGFAGEAGLEQSQIVCDRFLWFRVTRPAGSRLLTLDLRALRLSEARRTLPIGTLALLNSKFTVRHDLQVVPINK